MATNSPIVGYYQVEPKENAYFFLRVTFSLLIVGFYIYMLINDKNIQGYSIWLMAASLIWIAFMIWIYSLIIAGLRKGYIKNNSVLISEHQLPEVYTIVKNISEQLNLSKVPKVYLIQAGGALNAFATRLHYKNYVVIYSDLLDEFYQGNEETVRFVIAHELGHIKQRHMLKHTITFPSIIIPFLNSAYSRACEYTCDNIGAFFSPSGAVKGMATLAAGKVINSHINHQSLIDQVEVDGGFWCWFVEKCSSHPRLSKRMKRVYREVSRKVQPIVVEEAKSERNHESYMPR